MELRYVYSDELYHHGVKGMRWGVRRYVNENGTLTAAGKKRYYNEDGTLNKRGNKVLGSNKSNGQLRFESKYISKGMSKREAAIKADITRRNIAAIAGTAGGITLAIVAKRGLNRLGARYCDKVIKSGTNFRRITTGAGKTARAGNYMSYGMLDGAKYRGMYGVQRKAAYGGDIFETTRKATSNMKIASINNSEKMFKDYVQANKNMSLFAPTIDSKKAWRKAYKNFNINKMMDHGVSDDFLKYVKKQGYDGIVDLNDLTRSGYNAKTATILSDVSKLSKVSERKINNGRMAANYAIGINAAQSHKRLGTVAGIAGVGYTGAFTGKSNEKTIKLMGNKGYRTSDISKATGYDPTYINEILKKKKR